MPPTPRSREEIDRELEFGSEPYKQQLLQAGQGEIDLPSVVAVHKLNLLRAPRSVHPAICRDLALTYWLLDKKGLARTYARKYLDKEPATVVDGGEEPVIS